MLKNHIFIIATIIIILIPSWSKKYTPPTTRILFVFDGSQSMYGNWESDKKINIARYLLFEMIDSLNKLEEVKMALRIYGHQSYVPPQDCGDTRLEVPFEENNGEIIKHVLKNIKPKGTTPIAYSLEQAQFDFPPCSNCRNIIILITDGIEACDGDPCEVSRKLQKKGIILKPFIIGIGFDPGLQESFKCVGNYYNATNEKEFKEVLNIVITRALNSTTAQINLLDLQGNPTETDVNMTFYDKTSGKIKYNLVHTINNRGNPDTLILDPLLTYKVKVHTLPPKYIDSIKLTPGKHSKFYAETPQGNLIVKTNEQKYQGIKYSVREAGKANTLSFLNVNSSEKFIVGEYDIEIPTIPVIRLNDVVIQQSKTTTIDIPRPGSVTLDFNARGYGSIYKETENDLEWVYNTNTTIVRETILLLPGSYKAVFRTKNASNSYFTITKSFDVTPGKSLLIKFQ